MSSPGKNSVSVSRALAQQPTIILADEPVASLDPASAETVLSLLSSICKQDDITAIVSLHHLEFARTFADRIVGIADAGVVFDDVPAELNDRSLARIYGGKEAPRATANARKPVSPQPAFEPIMEMYL